MGFDEYTKCMKSLACYCTIAVGFLALIGMTVFLISVVSVPPPTSIETREYNESADQRSKEFVSSKRELNAQEGVWRASNALAYFTAIATVIGVIGLFLLRETLLATRRTLEATVVGANAANRTADAAQSAETAHLFAKLKINFIGSKGSEKTRAEANVYLFNAGKTPAKDVFLRVAHTHQMPGDYGPPQVSIDMDWEFLRQLQPDSAIRGGGGYKPEFGRRFTPFLADRKLSLPKSFKFETVLDVPHPNDNSIFHMINRPVFLVHCTYTDIFNKPRELRLMASLFYDVATEYGNREDLINQFDAIEVKYTEVKKIADVYW